MKTLFQERLIFKLHSPQSYDLLTVLAILLVFLDFLAVFVVRVSATRFLSSSRMRRSTYRRIKSRMINKSQKIHHQVILNPPTLNKARLRPFSSFGTPDAVSLPISIPGASTAEAPESVGGAILSDFSSTGTSPRTYYLRYSLERFAAQVYFLEQTPERKTVQ